MRFLYPLLFVVLILIVGNTFLKTVVGADPNEEAIKFMETVRGGSLAQTVKHFGSNVCRCPHKGGWGAYLIYISAQEPNLAFITGHPFEIGKPELHRMKNNIQAPVPWQKPEDTAVDVPIRFDPQKYSPLFLPLKTAYGLKITQADLEKFLKDPDADSWKGFTLRFRTSLAPGAIAPPAEPLPPDARKEFKDLAPKNPSQKEYVDPTARNLTIEPEGRSGKETKDDESTEDAVKKALGAEAVTYLKPKDAGPVEDASGATIPPDKVAAQLPRLASCTVRLHVVRRGAVNEWTIFHFGIIEPVLHYPDGHEIALDHYLRPMGDHAVKASQIIREQLDTTIESENK